MAIEITLIRHGETEANAAGVWQGTLDSPLTDAGRDQVARLSDRFAASQFDLVVTSNLGRARETSGALGPAEIDDRWRELHVGSWEGLSMHEIIERDPDVMAALKDGEDVAFGGGEKVSEAVTRVLAAFHGVVGRLDDGQRALIVSHGGILLTLIGVLLGVETRGRMLRLTNTSVTTIRLDDGHHEVSVFNDTTHLPGVPVRAEEGATHVMLARHGESVANTQGRWQGQSGGKLTPQGAEQARLLAAEFPAIAALYSSPLARALETARLVGDSRGMVPRKEADLQELAFGGWEMMTTAEIEASDPSGLADLVAGTDVARGGTGETLGALRDRVARVIGEIVERHAGETIGVVSHGAATRAYATGILELDFPGRRLLGLLENTAMARVVYGSTGPAIASWNLTSHLGR